MPSSLAIETATAAGVVADLTGAAARSVERMTAGEVNRVYRVETADGAAFVVKVFRHPDWPEPGKLLCVERRLTEQGVPHPRLLRETRDDQTFPHGFSLTEYVRGRDCAAALEEGALSLADYCRGVGALLREVHKVSFPRFGYVGNCEGTEDDYVETKLAYDVRDRLREVDPSALPSADTARRVEEKVRRLLAPHAGRFAPVLVHGDAAPRNTILAEDGRLVLADWDEAVAGVALEDYARLTYLLFRAHHSRLPDAEAERVVRDSFFEGYGETGFDPAEVESFVDALHTVQAADHLAYYFKTGDAAAFEETKALLSAML